MPAATLTPAQWNTLEQLFDAVLDQAEPDRAAYLKALDLSSEVREQLERWLAAESEGRDFLTAQAPADLLAAGDRLGNWRVLGLIGRGGSGEVYRVERADGSYEQQAALKLLVRPEEPDDLRRFAAERRLLARLEHPDIARLLDGGAHEGRPYAVIELIEGARLDTYVRPLSLAARLALFLRICRAVAHAHRHLIVHRDLKPANVFVTPQGAPKLLDFGIAKPVDASGVEATLALRLTPDYCAPEQLTGGAVTPAADVFALGVMLHELLTGRAPWRLAGVGVQRALERLASNDLAPPSESLDGVAARTLRGDLDAIVMKALRRDPRERYGNAEALADDLQRHLEGRPVLARGEAPAYLLGRLLRRHRAGFAAAAAVLLAVIAGAAGIAIKAREAAVERDIAQEEASRNAAVKDYLLTLFRIAGETQGADTLTPRQLLDQGAARLSEDVGKDPEQAADTLLALAQLYFSLNDYAGAVPLFERLLTLQPPIAPALAAQARYDLAQCYLRMSRTAEARATLQEAQRYWQTQPDRYRNRLLESRLPQAQLERAEGDAERSIRTLEQALEERIALSGENFFETGILLNNLAVAYFQANRLADARQYFERTWAVWETLGATASVDALNTLNNWAAVEAREQQYVAAEALFRKALNLRRQLFGPSAALAALLNNLGKLQLLLGNPAAAEPLLTEAVQLARQFAGENSLNALAAMAGLGEAQAGIGAAAQARDTLDDMEARVLEHFGRTHLLAAIAHLAQARRLAAAQQSEAALQRLQAADAVLAAAGPQAATYTPQVTVLREQLRRLGAGTASSAP